MKVERTQLPLNSRSTQLSNVLTTKRVGAPPDLSHNTSDESSRRKEEEEEIREGEDHSSGSEQAMHDGGSTRLLNLTA
jgi:hypothetical protein